MGRGYSGANLIADLDIDYNYQGHDYDSFDDITNLFQMNLYFRNDLDCVATNVDHIMEQAEAYARSFIEQNGTIQFGNLLGSVKAQRTSNTSFSLTAPARDRRGHLYAGHIEYGFTDKAGQAHGPWPFLRPAVKLAAMDSRGELADALASQILYGDVINGALPWRLEFGRSGASHSDSKAIRAFHNMSNAHRRVDSKGKTYEWGKAKNGFNDYSGFYPKGTSSNQWTTGFDQSWDFGEL